MKKTTIDPTKLAMSADERDFYSTIQWIETQRAKGNGEFHLPNGKLYPFLHIENSSEFNDAIVKCYDAVKEHKIVYHARPAMQGAFDTNLATNKKKEVWARNGANHISIGVNGNRIAIIYFDPYEI